MGSALSTFTDFVNSTGPTYLTSSQDIVNEAVKRTYMLSRWLKGRDISEVVQGGRTIKDDIMLDEAPTARTYQPNETFTPQNPQVLTEWEINWRYVVDHMTATDQEFELQGNFSSMTRSARHQVYKDLKWSKEQRMWTSMFNFMENLLWAQPNKGTMEAAAGTEPYSIPAFVNEYTNGLFAVPDAGAGLPGGNWTTVMGINPATKTKWVPQQESYGSTSPTASNADVTNRNIVQAMDRMWMKIRFMPPAFRQEYFEKAELNRQVIAASNSGVSIYQNLMRISQDLYASASRQDPAYVNPAYAGISLVPIESLGSALLYLDATTTPDSLVVETSSATDNSGPRYYFLNGNYIKPVWHARRYFNRTEGLTPPNQPFTTFWYVDSWYNVVCRSRQRQGIVYPTGAVYTAP